MDDHLVRQLFEFVQRQPKCKFNISNKKQQNKSTFNDKIYKNKINNKLVQVTSSPSSLQYSMSNSCSVSICSFTNAIGTMIKFFFPCLT